MRKFKVGSVVWEVSVRDNANDPAYFVATCTYPLLDRMMVSVEGVGCPSKTQAWGDAMDFMKSMGGEEIPA